RFGRCIRGGATCRTSHAGRSGGACLPRARGIPRWTSRVIRRTAALLLIVGALSAVACIDMSAPSGPATISVLLLPSPSVVAGDTMRDSAGVVAPLRVIAYDANSTPIPGAIAQFFLTDTTATGHIANSDLLVGDQVGSLHVLGQISWVQTKVVVVPVTIQPTILARGSSPIAPL